MNTGVQGEFATQSRDANIVADKNCLLSSCYYKHILSLLGST